VKFAYTRLVTEDVPRLASFYENILGLQGRGEDSYVELHPGGAILAIVSSKAARFIHGGNGPQALINRPSSSSKLTTWMPSARVSIPS
jgi:hypothetical protein